MTIDEMKIRKKELGWSNEELADRSGVPLGTVQKVFGGATTAPRRKTIEALEAAFAQGLEEKNRLSQGRKTAINYAAMYEKGTGKKQYLAESTLPYGKNLIYGIRDPGYKKQGEYTIEDYYALPDDVRCELIDGVLYDMAAPTSVHQILVFRIATAMGNFVRKNKGNCIVLPAPLDVQLDMDEKTMLQPDVVVICSRDRIRMKGGYGAPDLVAEVLSPSSIMKDSVIKLMKYKNAGVRECWIVDPARRLVWTYYFENDMMPVGYTFSDRVPVRIWDGKCEVDFAEICEEMRFLYEEAVPE